MLVVLSHFCCDDLVSNTLFFVFVSDVTTTMIIKEGPVVDFLLANQGVNDLFHVDWAKVIYLLYDMWLCHGLSRFLFVFLALNVIT